VTTDSPPAIVAPAPARDLALENALLVEMVVDSLWTNRWIHSSVPAGWTPTKENDPLARPTAHSLAAMLAEAGAVQFGVRLIPAGRLKTLGLGLVVAGEGANVVRNLTLSAKL